MKKYKIAICDDEFATIEVIQSVVSASFSKAGVAVDIETYTSVESLARRIKAQVYDLLFLDICMPKCDGISFGEALRKAGDGTEIVFVSNREEKVFDALKIRPFAFVRKKNFLSEITAAVNNFLAFVSEREASTIAVQGKGGIFTVRISEITYFEGSGKVQLMHVLGKADPIPVYRTMEKLEEQLGEKGFIRVHKGMLVNFRFISQIMVGDIKLTTGELIPLARRKATEIKERYLELLKAYGSILL